MEQVINILREYQAFTEDSKDSSEHKSLADFGQYLCRKKDNIPKEYKTDQEEVNTQNIDVMLSYLLGGLSLYLETWLKISYKDMPVRSLGDFSILMAVKTQHKPTKKDISEKVVMEHSTCMEAIKRLVKAGIFKESVNPSDKRSLIVELTEFGKETIEKLNDKMKELSKLLTGKLSLEEKQQIFGPLNKLSHFHRDLYHSSSKAEIQEQYNL